jgi:hypothetical protein
VPDTDLVIAGFVIQGNEEETTSGVAEVINSIVATWNRALNRQSDLVEAAIRDTQTPNKILDRMDMFLLRLGGENNRRAPRPEALPDPSISLQNLSWGPQ